MLLNIFTSPWPWYVAGPLIGLMIPTLLIIGNKSFGFPLRYGMCVPHVFPANISFFKYDWKKEAWNLFFVSGILIGAFLAAHFFSDPNPCTNKPQVSH